MRTLFLVVLLVSVLAMPALAIDWVRNPSNGHYYALIYCQPSSENWVLLETQAVSLGGHLVSISDAEENSWVCNLAHSILGEDNKRIWIGLSSSGGWHWTSGDPITYTNWSPNNPSHSTPWENYGEMYVCHEPEWYPYGSWNDNGGDPASLITAGVVEVVPEPSSLLVLGSLIAPLVLLRRKKR